MYYIPPSLSYCCSRREVPFLAREVVARSFRELLQMWIVKAEMRVDEEGAGKKEIS